MKIIKKILAQPVSVFRTIYNIVSHPFFFSFYNVGFVIDLFVFDLTLPYNFEYLV
jgi:hypothetical protein